MDLKKDLCSCNVKHNILAFLYYQKVDPEVKTMKQLHIAIYFFTKYSVIYPLG